MAPTNHSYINSWYTIGPAYGSTDLRYRNPYAYCDEFKAILQDTEIQLATKLKKLTTINKIVAEMTNKYLIAPWNWHFHQEIKDARTAYPILEALSLNEGITIPPIVWF